MINKNTNKTSCGKVVKLKSFYTDIAEIVSWISPLPKLARNSFAMIIISRPDNICHVEGPYVQEVALKQ